MWPAGGWSVHRWIKRFQKPQRIICFHCACWWAGIRYYATADRGSGFRKCFFCWWSGVFEDEEQDKKAIGNVAQTLLDHPQNSVYVVGCTASATGKEDFCQTLSAARASAVVELLKNFGVPAEQMKAVGMGSRAPWHVPDLDASGHQIEEYAKQNRCVVILDTLDPEYGEVVASYFWHNKQACEESTDIFLHRLCFLMSVIFFTS